jgi:peptidoglycan/xylan/chitin deacetylase (PgdA/CDA1 family)
MLTFDDGPFAHTGALLDLLEEYNVRATFFLVGQNLESGQDMARRIHKAGHVLANHSWTHADLGTADIEVIRSELERTSEAIRQVTGNYPTLFRAPFLNVSEPLQTVCNELNMEIIGADVIGKDWEDISPEEIANNVLQNAHDGGVILLHEHHDPQNLRTLKALPAIIAGLRKNGFEIDSCLS